MQENYIMLPNDELTKLLQTRNDYEFNEYLSTTWVPFNNTMESHRKITILIDDGRILNSPDFIDMTLQLILIYKADDLAKRIIDERLMYREGTVLSAFRNNINMFKYCLPKCNLLYEWNVRIAFLSDIVEHCYLEHLQFFMEYFKEYNFTEKINVDKAYRLAKQNNDYDILNILKSNEMFEINEYNI